MRAAVRRTAHRLARRLLPRTPPGVREVALALAARAGSGPAVLPGVPPGPVLVVAAHPDDETIGCGGALARHAEAGDDVTVVVATSGEATSGGGRDVAAARERECHAACAALGLRAPHFLHLPDGRLRTRVGDLGSALRDLGRAAAVAYVPHLLDPHPDHLAANLALADAGLDAEVLGTELWSAAPVDAVLDIGQVWERKDRALRCYPVALESVDYRAAAAGLAAYRGVLAGLGPAGLAEGFVRLAAAEHRELAARVGGRCC